MQIRLSSPRPVDPKDLMRLQSWFSKPIPEELLRFYAEFNGASIECNIFDVSETYASSLRGLIPVSGIIDEIEATDRFEQNLVPISYDDCGNYVVADLADGASIYFWDHETRPKRHKLADGIFEFLQMVRPFKPDELNLKENQVISAWIDPEFLASLKNS